MSEEQLKRATGELSASAPRERTITAPETAGHVLLAIDTALGSSVALGCDGRIVEVSSDDARGHAENIGTLIARAFELSGSDPLRVTGVVVGVGPGPFTGLRVGIAAAHAFSIGREAPLLPLQSHEAVAFAAMEHHAATQVRVVQDAKRRELFVTEYRDRDTQGLPVRITEPRLLTRAAYEPRHEDVWPERIPAARLVQLAARRLNTDRKFEPGEALYLRMPDVAQPSAPKRVST